jgi:glycosyltransferase involved in cell wall biosynthesis
MQCVEQLGHFVRQLEIIVIEDGSSDESASVLRELQKLYPALEVIWHTSNQGYGASLNDGILRARYEYTLCSDGDGQFHIADFYRLFDEMESGIDIVGGTRSPRADEFYRRFFGIIFNAIVRSILAPDLNDVDCGFKLFRTSSVKTLVPAKSRMAVWVEIMNSAHKKGYKCKSVPVRHFRRRHGKSTTFTGSNVILLLKELRSIVATRWSVAALNDKEMDAASPVIASKAGK